MPFFGLELRERKAKINAPAYQSISFQRRENSPVAIALQNGPVPTQDMINRRGRSKVVVGIVTDERQPFSQDQDDDRPILTEPLDLPVTERTSVLQPASQFATDFQ